MIRRLPHNSKFKTTLQTTEILTVISHLREEGRRTKEGNQFWLTIG
jgi:hypothetical protein